MLEPVRLRVSDVRREIYRASGCESGPGQATTEALGSLFHRVFQALMHPESKFCWTTVLDTESLPDHQRLLEHAYVNIIGPWLRERRPVLQTSSLQVVAMWQAAGHLCQYICQLLTNAFEQRRLRYDARKQRWLGADQFSVEEELLWLVDDETWSSPVVVSGVADAVWRNQNSRTWCVLELKLGAGSSAADLAQLCLYHEMLRSKLPGSAGQVSLFHFQPELQRSSLTEEQIEPVKPKLHALIGRMAGVAGNAGSNAPGNGQNAAHRDLGVRLVQVLEQFGPMVTMESDPVVGPTFLRFHITPDPGVRVERILPLGGNLAVQLKLSKPAIIRLEGGTLVVDVQRPDRQTLYFREFRHQLPSGKLGNASILVGVDLQRQPRFADLNSECCHILAAGTTYSGKSEWLRMAVASLLVTNTPKTLRLVVIDPKLVTFGELLHSPFLLDQSEIFHTPEGAIKALNRLAEIMDERYLLLSKHGCVDLEALKAKTPDEAPPRIVCFCDEYGNLVAEKKDRDRIEQAINQLGAKARAAGIHLVLATQDPRAQILSPALKSNLTGRVCLRTTSTTQSRMMLDENGAESLLGKGDLFFKTVGEPVRLQAPLLEDAERLELFS